MAKLDFVFLAMGAGYQADIHHASFMHPRGKTTILCVETLEEACAQAKKLAAEGVNLIELCGAFGKEGADAIAKSAGDGVAVGYVIHDPSQDDNFAALRK